MKLTPEEERFLDEVKTMTMDAHAADSSLIDPRLRPHLDALLDAAAEVIEDWRCNDVEDGDALIACGLLYELNDAVEALRANLDGGELLPPCA